MRRRISRAQQTKNWCVGFSFPPPAYAGIHPTLYLFGFRADALNSHSSLICLASIQGLVSSASIPFQDLPERLWAFPFVAFGAPKPSGGLRGLGRLSGLWCPRFRGGLRAPLRLRGPPAGLGGPPGASGVPPGASGGPRGGLGGISGALSLLLGLDVGFGSGFRVFWPPSTTPCLADPKFQHFPGHLLETAGQWAPRATPRKPPRPRSLGLGFLNNLVNHRKGEGVP